MYAYGVFAENPFPPRFIFAGAIVHLKLQLVDPAIELTGYREL